MPILPLYLEVQQTMQWNQRQTADALGISPRTVQRWSGGGSSPSYHYPALAAHVLPRSRALAERLAAAGGTTLAALGLVAPAPGGPSTEHIVDSVLCAAAVAADMKPLDVRPALAAAFTRARALGLTLEEVERALAAPEAAAAAKKKKGP